jgi:purine-nucleoside phosphorylase
VQAETSYKEHILIVYEQAIEALQAIQARISLKPAVGLILGSGLGDLATEIQDGVAIPYAEIPHFARSTVAGHAGRLLIGTLESVPVVAMQGRFHLYEGNSAQTITLPVRVMQLLGASSLIVSNAAGGVNPAYLPGHFMLIRDHIFFPGLAGNGPLVGPHDERLGARFPAVAKAYDADLRALAHSIAVEIPGLTVHEGVYAMVAGPNFETPAELTFLRMIGADAVGMSTVPEVIVARQIGMHVLGVSLITNTATGNETEEVNHGAVLATADAVRSSFAAFVRGIVHNIDSHV